MAKYSYVASSEHRDNNDAAKKKLNLWTLSAKREFLVF
jgi:hypothetical protein